MIYRHVTSENKLGTQHDYINLGVKIISVQCYVGVRDLRCEGSVDSTHCRYECVI